MDKKWPARKQPSGGPTKRQKAAADLIASGVPIEDALLQAGYGQGAVRGLAPVYVPMLVGMGLMASKRGPGRPSKDKTAAAEPPVSKENGQ